MNYFAIALLSLFITMLIWPFFNELCKTIKHCATARAIGKLNAQGLQIREKDLEKMLNGEDDGK